MESTKPEKQEEQNQLPDFVEQKAGSKTINTETEQENHPKNGNQSQSGAATDNSALDIEPTEDGDDSLAGTDD